MTKSSSTISYSKRFSWIFAGILCFTHFPAVDADAVLTSLDLAVADGTDPLEFPKKITATDDSAHTDINWFNLEIYKTIEDMSNESVDRIKDVTAEVLDFAFADIYYNFKEFNFTIVQATTIMRDDESPVRGRNLRRQNYRRGGSSRDLQGGMETGAAITFSGASLFFLQPVQSQNKVDLAILQTVNSEPVNSNLIEAFKATGDAALADVYEVRAVAFPSEAPSLAPSQHPSQSPTVLSSVIPTLVPSITPSKVPSLLPSILPTLSPSLIPSNSPSSMPSLTPSLAPSTHPSIYPSLFPSELPSSWPSTFPSLIPSLTPSLLPSSWPSLVPSLNPTHKPSSFPSNSPSLTPTIVPSLWPSLVPSFNPTQVPSKLPSFLPSVTPSILPSSSPSSFPSLIPSHIPSFSPSLTPSRKPSEYPSSRPSLVPSMIPSKVPSKLPSIFPSVAPSILPTQTPSSLPSFLPTQVPSQHPSNYPTLLSSVFPSKRPSFSPSISPSQSPSKHPTNSPSQYPSISPSLNPSRSPSAVPTLTSFPSTPPTNFPSIFTITAIITNPIDTGESGTIIYTSILLGAAFFLIFGLFLRKRRRDDEDSDEDSGELVTPESDIGKDFSFSNVRSTPGEGGAVGARAITPLHENRQEPSEDIPNIAVTPDERVIGTELISVPATDEQDNISGGWTKFIGAINFFPQEDKIKEESNEEAPTEDERAWTNANPYFDVDAEENDNGASFETTSTLTNTLATAEDEKEGGNVAEPGPIWSKLGFIKQSDSQSAVTNSSQETGASKDSKKLINDLKWLEKRIAEVKSATGSTGDSAMSSTGESTALATAAAIGGAGAIAAIPSSPSSAASSVMSPIMQNIVCRDVYAPSGKLNIFIQSTRDGPIVYSLNENSNLLGQIFPGDLIIAIDNVDTRSMAADDLLEIMKSKNDLERKITVLHFEA